MLTKKQTDMTAQSSFRLASRDDLRCWPHLVLPQIRASILTSA